MTIDTNMTVVVSAITQVAESVKRFRLTRSDGAPLPLFSGGSHVIVTMNDGDRVRRNAYSLMSSPRDCSAYELSILRTNNSRGGSTFLHDKVRVGDSLIISQPVNLFPLDARARKHVFVAGGIGITPFMAMMDQLTHEGRSFELHYAIRNRGHGAFWRELVEMYGADRVTIYVDDEKQFIPVETVLAAQALGTHLFVCGPEGMINGVLTKARNQGWPEQSLHCERFLAPPPGDRFRAVLKRAGMTIEVASHQSILEAVEAAGVDARYMCRGGACGECETNVLSHEGTIVHNDHYLEPVDRSQGRKIMICVSRLAGKEIVLDL